jgi:hypothetical protein
LALPLGQGLPDEGVMRRPNINPSIRQPSAKPTLMGLSNLSATDDIHTKPIEVNVLALEDTNHHPAQGLEMSDIVPEVLALTQIFMQRMIETGSRGH